MSFTKIDTNTDFIGKGAMSLADQPTISASELKRKFDEPAREVVTPKFNNLIDELEATTAAASLGAVAPTGRTGATVQAVVNSVSADLATLEGSVAQVIADDHTHSNKALLDSYTQSETDLADAVTKKHEHSNKSLLDSYTQTNTDLADAVSKKHDHSNKSLLDSYTQTETDIADAVTKKHEHSNKAVLDKFSEVSGDPYYDGNPIGGGGSGDTFKNIVSASTTFTASGEDTFKINAGSNVTISALSSPDKGIQISATGGGQSTGDMLMADYDSSGDVKTAGGIDAYVADEIGKLDVSDSAVSGQYVSAVSESDGKISVSRTNLPSIPTITDTYSGTSSDGMSGKAVKSAIDALDVSDSAVSGQYVSAVSETDGKISVTRASLPAIPTVNNATLTIQQNGTQVQTFTANASSNATANIVTGEFIKTASVSSGSVTFTGINDTGTKGYDVFFDITGNSTNKSPYAKLTSISGEGTSNMSLTYETDADDGTNTAQLYQYK